MIAYAVNRETKEHRRADGIWQQMKYGTDWKIVQADIDGWIPWEGGECPLPDGSRYAVRLRNGAVYDDLCRPESCNGEWEHSTRFLDITAYRPILDEPSEPEAADWNGDGLPPVGCECEAMHDSEWVDVEVIAHYEPLQDGEKVAVYAYRVDNDVDGKGRLTGQLLPGNFRPIRSEEDRAVEAMLALDDYDTESYNSGMMSRDDFCRALYRSGYRKG